MFPRITTITGTRNKEKGNEDSGRVATFENIPLNQQTASTIKSAYEVTNKAIAKIYHNLDGIGSTCASVMAWKQTDPKTKRLELVCVTNHLGDSGISVHIIKKDGTVKNIQLTADHVPSNESENERLEEVKLFDREGKPLTYIETTQIIEKGVVVAEESTEKQYSAKTALIKKKNELVERVEGIDASYRTLMTTRGFGDSHMRPSGYSSEGEISIHKPILLDDGDRVYVSAWSDGIKEQNPNYLEQLGDAFKQDGDNIEKTQKKILQKTLTNGSTDDCTIGSFEANNTIQSATIFDGHGRRSLLGKDISQLSKLDKMTPSEFSEELAMHYHENMLTQLACSYPKAYKKDGFFDVITLSMDPIVEMMSPSLFSKEPLSKQYKSKHPIKMSEEKYNKLEELENKLRALQLNNPDLKKNIDNLNKIIKTLEDEFKVLLEGAKTKKNPPSLLVKFGISKSTDALTPLQKLEKEPAEHHATRLVGLLLKNVYQAADKMGLEIKANKEIRDGVLSITDPYTKKHIKEMR